MADEEQLVQEPYHRPLEVFHIEMEEHHLKPLEVFQMNREEPQLEPIEVSQMNKDEPQLEPLEVFQMNKEEPQFEPLEVPHMNKKEPQFEPLEVFQMNREEPLHEPQVVFQMSREGAHLDSPEIFQINKGEIDQKQFEKFVIHHDKENAVEVEEPQETIQELGTPDMNTFLQIDRMNVLDESFKNTPQEELGISDLRHKESLTKEDMIISDTKLLKDDNVISEKWGAGKFPEVNELPNDERIAFPIQKWKSDEKSENTLLMNVARVSVAIAMGLLKKYSNELSALFDLCLYKALTSLKGMLAVIQKAVFGKGRFKIKYSRRYRKERDALKKKCTKHRRQLQKLNMAIGQKVQRIHSNQKLVAKEEQKKCETQIHQAKENLKHATQAKVCAEKEMHTTKHKLQQMARKRSHIEKEIQTTKDKMHEMSKELNSSEKKVQKTQEKLSKLTQEVERKDKDIKTLNDNLLDLKEEIEKKDKEIGESRDKLQMIIKDRDQLRTKLSRGNEKNQDLQTKVDEERESRRATEERIFELQAHTSQKQAQMKSITMTKEKHLIKQRGKLLKDLEEAKEKLKDAVQQVEERKKSKEEKDKEVKYIENIMEKERLVKTQLQQHLLRYQNERANIVNNDEELNLRSCYFEKMKKILIKKPSEQSTVIPTKNTTS